MYQKDYIMRMIEAFAKMVAGIIGLIKKGDPDGAISRIKETYDIILKINPEELYQFDDHEWYTFCKERSLDELEMIAELFKLEGEIRMDAGNSDEGLRMLYRSLELFKYVDGQSGTFSVVRFEKITTLEEELSGADH
jgi:hypothetical protein